MTVEKPQNWVLRGWNALQLLRWQLVMFKQILMMREKLTISVESPHCKSHVEVYEKLSRQKARLSFHRTVSTLHLLAKAVRCDKFPQHARHKKLPLQTILHNSGMSHWKPKQLQRILDVIVPRQRNDKKVEDLHA